MNEIDWSEQQNQSAHTPSDDAANTPDGSQDTDVLSDPPSAQNSTSGVSAVLPPLGDAQSDEAQQADNDNWPPSDAVLLTTDEARLYLYKHYDIFLRERYTQRLVTDYHKLDGRRMPKDGGGVELQMTQVSLDDYARDNTHKKNAKDTPLDPDDKLFNELREIAGAKGYNVPIDGDVRTRHATSAPDNTVEGQSQTPAQEEKSDVEPSDHDPMADRERMVPEHLYLKAIAEKNTLFDITTDLNDRVSSMFDQVVDLTKQQTALMKVMQDKLESPSTITQGIVDVVRAANSDEDRRLPPTPMQQRGDNQASGHYRDDV